MKNFKFALSLLLVTSYLLLANPAYAAVVNPNPHPGRGVSIGYYFGFGNFTSLGSVVNAIVNPAFSIAAAVVVLYFLFGAFKFIQSRGNKEEVAAAQNIIIHAVIGFIILMSTFLILQYVLSSLFKVEGFRIIG